MAGKMRVKCANCGMTYDVYVGDVGDYRNPHGECPSCKSNAYDKIPEVWRQTEK